MIVGQGAHRYELVPNWGPLPEGYSFQEIAAVAVDSKDNVYAYHRGSNPVIVFDEHGSLINSWGDDVLGEAHGMFISPSDDIYLVDRSNHTIEKCDPNGNPLLTFGEKGHCSPAFSNRPFNLPQGVAVSATGDVYVADGKNNNAVHKYSSDGRHLLSWGSQGTGPGEFNEPHGIWVARDGTVIVADRGNNRLQFFRPDGDYLSEWGENVIHHPDHIYIDQEGVIYVTEIEYHRVSILSPTGQLLSRWGGGPGIQEGRLAGTNRPGYFDSPHGIWGDSKGSLYISEVRGGRRIQKFVRV